MINKNYKLILFVLLTTILKADAQDAVFAQYYASPVHLNPAMMGVYQGQYRFNANYRQQWSRLFSDNPQGFDAPLRTIHASFDYRYRIVDEDYLAFGINAIEDESGALTKLKSTRGNIGVSYMKQLSGNRYSSTDQYLILGAQVGTGQFGLNLGDVWFDRQFDSTTISVNNASPTGELTPQSAMFFNVNAGLMWYTVMDDNKSFYVGASAHNLTEPNISFLGNKGEAMRRRFTVNVGGEFPINEQLSVLPAVMATVQGPSMTSMFGANFRYTNHDWQEVAVRIGGSYRLANKYVWKGAGTAGGSSILGDALTVTGMLELNHWLIGGSYDIHTSSIARPTNARGAWELSLIYIAPERIPYRTRCPKF
jgi:type IX secretion system PorP/SprF family membrane protein